MNSDKDRLDFMIAYSARMSWSRDNEVCNVWVPVPDSEGDDREEPAEGWPQKNYYDPREAIDKAMKHLKYVKLKK